MKKNLLILAIGIAATVILTILIPKVSKYLQTDLQQSIHNLSVFQPDQSEIVSSSVTSSTDKASRSLIATGGTMTGDFIPDPINTVYDFYDALNKQNCENAVLIRPDYNIKYCYETEKVPFMRVDPLQIDLDKAAVQIEVVFKKKDKPEERFEGYTWLQKTDSGFWQIKKLASSAKMSPEKFMTDLAGMKPNSPTEALQEGSEPPLSTLPIQQPDILENIPGKVAIISPDLDHKDKLTKPQDKTIDQGPIAEAIPPVTLNQEVDVTSIRSFGSEKILNACWTPEQLRGNPTDKKIISQMSDHSPPLKQQPYHKPKSLISQLRGSIRAVKIPDPHKKLVALTFDLCERASEITGYDAELVNYLRDHDVPATFYAGGKWMRSHPDQTKQLMADPRFEVGNHAWTHGNMRMLTGNEMKNQILWTQAQYELLRDSLAEDLLQCGVPQQEINKLPPIPLSFRYPYGTCSREALDFMGDYGLPSVQWNIVTADPWRKQTADGIVKTVLQSIKSGSIIIAHANGRGWNTRDALTKLVPALRAKGYRFVTVTELLAEGKEIESTDTCYELRLGDNQSYDKKVGKGTE